MLKNAIVLNNWFMQRNQISTDGFVVRRRSQTGDIQSRPKLALGKPAVPSQYLVDVSGQSAHSADVPILQRRKEQSPAGGLASPQKQRLNLDLNIDDLPSSQTSGKGGKKPRGKKRITKKMVKRTALGLLVILLLVGGYFGYKILTTSGKIFKGNPIAAIFDQGKPLKTDANGNSNIVLFGTSEDDPGHPGGDLTDSIMVASINQKRKDGYIVSVPRDLHVKYDMSCISGTSGKINVLYSCAKSKGNEDSGSETLRKKLGEVFGLDIQYSAHVNYTVLREAVDAVGGITVNIQGDDPRGILDRNFDWDCPKGVYTCYNVKYPNGPANLNGKQALYLARARGDVPPTYGLSRSNPDRQDNQRKILIALKDKAASAGVLANPVAVNNLLTTLGNNLRTNFDASEVKTLIQLGKDIPSSGIASWSLEDPNHLLATASCFAGDVCPNRGSFDYTEIQAEATALGSGNHSVLENAKVAIYNASGTPGLAQTKATELTQKGFVIGQVGNAPATLGPKPIQFYDLSGGKKPGTLKELQKQLGVTVTQGAPAGISTTADFVVIVGAQPASTSDTSSSNSGQ